MELTDELLVGFEVLFAEAGLVPTNINDQTATSAIIIFANLRIPAPKAEKLVTSLWRANWAISSGKMGFG